MASRIPRIYLDRPLASDEAVALDRENSHYLSRVLRRQSGDKLVLFNGDGFNYHATLQSATGAQSTAQIYDARENPTESPLHISLVQGMAKGAKLDLIVQKAVELGVTAIELVSNDRSVLRIREDKTDKKLTHWKKIAISACAQCNRSHVPIISPPQRFEDWLQGDQNDATSIMLDPQATTSLMELKPTSRINILVGPEGGFSPAEIALAQSQRAIAVNCGPRILRTETAGFAVLAILQARFGDLRQVPKQLPDQ